MAFGIQLDCKATDFVSAVGLCPMVLWRAPFLLSDPQTHGILVLKLLANLVQPRNDISRAERTIYWAYCTRCFS